MLLKSTLAIGLTTLFLSTPTFAADAQMLVTKLITMPTAGSGSLQLVDVGAMPAHLDPGMMVILCDEHCQGMLHLAGKPAEGGKQVAMGITMYVDNQSKAAKLLGGR